jgi:hypothetical protein
MKRIIFFFPAFIISFLFFTAQAQAVCPVCTVAVIGGVGLSRWLGVDDTITGLWIGGLVVSMIFWTIDWLDRKKIFWKGRKTLIWIGYYALTIIPLYKAEILGHPLNRVWGIDKLLLGTILGSLGFLAGALIYPKIKEKNGGKAHFPFEKIAIAISPLVVMSVVFYLIIKF